MDSEHKTALAKRGESGCFGDDCELSHCSVCGRHFAGDFFGVGMARHETTCTHCEGLDEDEKAVVRAARQAKMHYLYPELAEPAAPITDDLDPEFDRYIDELNDEAERERKANRRLADLHQQRAERDNHYTE